MSGKYLLLPIILAFLGVFFERGMRGIVALVKINRLRRDHETSKRQTRQFGGYTPAWERPQPQESVPERPEEPVALPPCVPALAKPPDSNNNQPETLSLRLNHKKGGKPFAYPLVALAKC